MNCLQARKISEKVYWVGAIDWNIRDFHGYSTERGTTYNAFLVMDEKITLIDTVKAPFTDDLLSRISSIVDPKKIDYIVSNHSEMDHSGGLPAVIKAVQPRKVFCSVMGKKALEAHFDLDCELTAVKTSDTLSLGSNTLTFIETRMLHWPDSMFSYLDGEKILFSQDAFGMHLATSVLFTDECDPNITEWEAKKYFANILTLYSGKILDLIDALPSLNLDLEIVAPDHGPLWRGDDIGAAVERYRKWAAQEPQKKALVVYDTMWKSTEKMALAVADGLISKGIETDVLSLESRERSYAVTKLLDAGILMVGSSTLNNNLLPKISDVLTYFKGLKFKNLTGGSFGSFGWSGEAVGQIDAILGEMGVDLVSKGIKCKYVPTAETLCECNKLGIMAAEKLLEKLSDK